MSLAIQLNQIELDNDNLNDVCLALLTLSKLDLEPRQIKSCLKLHLMYINLSLLEYLVDY